MLGPDLYIDGFLIWNIRQEMGEFEFQAFRMGY